MTPEPITPAPRSRWRRWRLGRWLLVALLATFGYGAWREYDFRQAIKEVEALGWEWKYDDPIDTIRKDWKAAFRKATWTDGERYLGIPTAAELEPHARLVRRLAPTSLIVSGGPELKDLSALKGHPALQELYLRGCTGLTNVDALKGHPALQTLYLILCTGLTNVDAIKGLPALKELSLSGCTGLRNVDALKGLSGLQELYLDGCTNLSAEAIAALRASLPNTTISADY